MLIFLLFSCSQERREIKDLMRLETTVMYKAVNEKDTGWFRIDTSGRQIIGLLTFHYHNGKSYDGQFKGEMFGDTLKGYYDIKTRENGNWYRNPVAFLKRKGQLTMGIGAFIVPNWGSPYFDNGVPINFDKGRFVFNVQNSLENLSAGRFHKY
ncbi:MAG TPA: hypothetical protein VKB19_01965 [Pedobacter sp.]|nr:hypothetical protein [Pedobacter sp.]